MALARSLSRRERRARRATSRELAPTFIEAARDDVRRNATVETYAALGREHAFRYARQLVDTLSAAPIDKREAASMRWWREHNEHVQWLVRIFRRKNLATDAMVRAYLDAAQNTTIAIIDEMLAAVTLQR
jgi:hypothetical protein